MTARCASCRYPLTISDSIACYECSSYFHIDCAQLVGFPHYEFSSDPRRNTFHCTTCKILPLPRRRCDSDSDSDCECTMPSRQLDYHLEGQSDYAKDMNEVKGSIQDLSDLCKDMLREINELKSINLTLRCCVENLRHDNEQRDVLIGDLRRRLAYLEQNLNTGIKKKYEPDNWDEDRLQIDREDEIERYMTPEPDYGKTSDFEGSVSENIPEVNKNESTGLEEDNSGALSNLNDPFQSEHQELEKKRKDLRKQTGDRALSSNEDETKNKEFAESEVSNKENEVTENEDCNSNIELKAEVNKSKESVKDWTWSGDNAIEVGTEEDANESLDEECETEESEVADTEAQGWEILNEEVRSEQEVEDIQEVADYNLNEAQSDKDEDDEWKAEVDNDEGNVSEESQKTSRRVDDLNESLSTTDDYNREDEVVEDIYLQDVQKPLHSEVRTEDEMSEVSDQLFDERGEGELLLIEETVPEEGSLHGDEGDEGERDNLHGEDEGKVTSEEAGLVEGTPRLGEDEQIDGETGTGVERSERQPRDAGEPGVDSELQTNQENLGELTADGETQPAEPIPEGEERLLAEGESESAEPPPPSEPEHTEEDLWMYLKESVTSVRPATVQEFLEELIGTLQHVPEEYLKPVINANIKRATSPSVTDGDHLSQGGIPRAGGETSAIEGGDPLLSKEDEATLHLEQSAELSLETNGEQRDGEATTEADDGYSAVEGALLGGFWMVWLLYSMWDS